MGSAIGIIANPVSARDSHRVIANATALHITDRANIVLRILSCVKVCGVDKVLIMPENGGIRHHVRRGIDRAENQGLKHFPALEHLDYRISGTVDDTLKGARMMAEMGVAAIVKPAAGLEGKLPPTLLIWGKDDEVIPSAHAANLPGAKVHVIEGAGHMVFMEKAGDVNTLIKAHIASKDNG